VDSALPSPHCIVIVNEQRVVGPFGSWMGASLWLTENPAYAMYRPVPMEKPCPR
jgi:hypothetical protein